MAHKKNNESERGHLLNGRENPNNNNVLMNRFEYQDPNLSSSMNATGRRLNSNQSGRVLICLFIAFSVCLLIIKLSHMKQASEDKNSNHITFKCNGRRDQQSADTNSDLRQVSVFVRHGDRAPSQFYDLGMELLIPYIGQLWPRGLGNITDSGFLRMFRLGMELSRRYRVPLMVHNHTSILVLSSDLDRCVDSARMLIRGFYNFESTVSEGISQIKAYPGCAASGSKLAVCGTLADSGWPDQWQQVPIDTRSMPTLRSKFVRNNCPRFANSSCKLDVSLAMDSRLSSVVGFKELEQVVNDELNRTLNYNFTGFFPELVCILKLAIQSEVTRALVPHRDWLTRRVAGNETHSISLLDTWEQLNLMSDLVCQYEGDMGRIHMSPLLGALLDSQLTNLGHQRNVKCEHRVLFEGKRFIVHSTHDTVMEMLMKHLQISDIESGSFEERFFRLPKGHDEWDGFMAGFRRAQFGASLAFELWQTNNGFAYLRLLMYDKQDARYEDVEFKSVPLGRICKKNFQHIYGNLSIDEFYLGAPNWLEQSVQECPFGLWENITKSLVVDDKQLDGICNGSQNYSFHDFGNFQ